MVLKFTLCFNALNCFIRLVNGVLISQCFKVS